MDHSLVEYNFMDRHRMKAWEVLMKYAKHEKIKVQMHFKNTERSQIPMSPR